MVDAAEANVALLRPYINHRVAVTWAEAGGGSGWAEGVLANADKDWWVLRLARVRPRLTRPGRPARTLIVPADQKVTALVVLDEQPPGAGP